jgi:hypothetical protein
MVFYHVEDGEIWWLKYIALVNLEDSKYGSYNVPAKSFLALVMERMVEITILVECIAILSPCFDV